MSGTWGEGWASDFGGEPAEGLVAPPGTDRIGKAIHDVIAAAMGMDAKSVRPAGQMAPTGRTDEEFCTYQIISAQDAAMAERQIADDGAGSTVEGLTIPQYLTVSVNFYRGANAKTDDAGIPAFTTAGYDRAMRLPRRLQLTAFSEALRIAGLGFVGNSPARNFSSVVDGHRESRGQVDIYLSAIAQETAPLPVFSGLGSIGITVDNPAGNQSTKQIT